MQGKSVFTLSEVEIIKNLLRAKARATRSEQKKIRAKMRDLKFYITDFDQSQAGFTEVDFENLIKSKRIIISDSIGPASMHLNNALSKDWSEKINYEQLRESYKPDSISVLYIGESPPSGGTFFYAMNSNLFKCIKSAFIKVFGEKISDNTVFLKFFVTNNFYLEDLCIEPVNNRSNAERIVLRQEGIKPLSQRIKSYSPTAIIILMKGIESEVKDAINKSNINTQNIFVTTFPSFSQVNKNNCISENEIVLKKLIELEIIERTNT